MPTRRKTRERRGHDLWEVWKRGSRPGDGRVLYLRLLTIPGVVGSLTDGLCTMWGPGPIRGVVRHNMQLKRARPYLQARFIVNKATKNYFITMCKVLRLKPFVLSLPFHFLFISVFFAQRSGLEVSRSSAIDRNQAVQHLAIDAAGTRWVTNALGIFQLKGPDIAVKKLMTGGEVSVLNFHGGNADFAWSEAEFRKLAKTESKITAAWYDAVKRQLLVGTEEAGLFQCKTEPALEVVEKFTSGNSKMKSNHVTCIFLDKSGRWWVGTNGGLMFGVPGKWKSNLDNYEIRRVREYGTEIYLLGDGEIIKTMGGDKWTTITLDESKVENEIMDFDIDKNGKLWAVSGVVTAYDLLDDKYQVFDGSENYASYYGHSIAVDLDGNVWVATTDKGLYYIAKGQSVDIETIVEKGIDCNGNGKDAELRVRLVGGTPPFEYAWTGGLSGDNPKNVPPGNYEVTITDAKGHSRTTRIPVPDTRMKVTVKQKKSASGPDQADGVAEMDIAGNASGIKVQWDNGEVMVTATKLSPGKHTATVTNQKGCSATVSVEITAKAMALEAEWKDSGNGVRCDGDKKPVSVSVWGGKAPYTYQWSAGDMKGEKGDIGSGDHRVTVSDAAGAEKILSFSIKRLQPISAGATQEAAATTNNQDGRAVIKVSNALAPVMVAWDNGETGERATKLAPGKHAVTVTDANGCTAAASVVITEDIRTLNVQLVQKDKIKCAGDKVILETIVAGGKPPYQYAWGAGGQSSEQLGSVSAGNYALTITDAAGGKATAALLIEQPQPLSVTATVQTPASTGAADGQAAAQAQGGISPLNFRWDNGETLPEARQLAPGKRTLVVTDANGCTAEATVEITENILPLSVNITEKAPVKCSGDKTAVLQANIKGGKRPFQFTWSQTGLNGMQPGNLGAGEYAVTVADAVGNKTTASFRVQQPEVLTAQIDVLSPATTDNSDGKAQVLPKGGTPALNYAWDSGEKTAVAQQLAPGKHTVTVTDANGCVTTATVDITENILPLSIKLTEKSTVRCAGDKGAINVEVTGGKGPFEYNWNYPAAKGQSPVDLEGGQYNVTVTDARGMTATGTASFPVLAPLVLTLSRNLGVSKEGMSDGKAAVAVTGGLPPYTIVWDTKQTGANVNKLPQGAHYVRVADARGCTQKIDFTTDKRILPELTGAVENGQTIRMRLLNFQTDSSSITEEALPVLDELYDFLVLNSGVVIEVGGHTNNQPSDDFADKLSTARAKSVTDYLVAKGIDAQRVLHKGYGKRYPIASNLNPEGRKVNQRVEIKILKVSR